MTYVKTYLSTLKTHVVNLKRDAKGLSRDLQRLEVRGKLGSKTLYKQNRTNAQRESGLSIMSMISDRIGRNEFLLPIYYNYYIKNKHGCALIWNFSSA